MVITQDFESWNPSSSLGKSFFTRLAQLVERMPFKRVVVGSIPTSGEGKRQSLGLEPEVSEEMEKPNK